MESLTVGEMVTSRECIHPGTIVRRVTDKFFETSHLDAVALVEGEEPVGLVTRPKLLFTVFRRYGFELYGKRPVMAIADADPLTLHFRERLDVAVDLAFERDPNNIYDDIIVVDDNGLYKGLLSVRQMVTQQSHLLANSMIQKELAHAKAMEFEKMSRIRSQFLANVTHELRAPVNAIIGLAELMRISMEDGHVEQLGDRLTLMLSSSMSLRAIITNILDLSKIEAGKMETIYDRFDMVSLLSEIAETTRVLLGSKPVKVRLIATEESLFIESDPIKMRQVMTNLASNAAKFTENGNIDITLSCKDEEIEVSISDTGIGIKEEDMDRLFTAFGRVEKAETKRYEGTGLGLAITKELLDLLKGRVSVSSRFGEGTTFVVSLPLHKPNQETTNGKLQGYSARHR